MKLLFAFFCRIALAIRVVTGRKEAEQMRAEPERVGELCAAEEESECGDNVVCSVWSGWSFQMH
jgi:hypothetical protein